MKKVKTIILSLIVMFASAFVSACSCGGTGDGPKVYVDDISLNCIVEDAYKDNVTYTVDPTSGDLDITCHIDDHFIIEYNLTPEDTTTTQVNWAFDIKGYVEPARRDYTKNQSAREKVEFVAIGRSPDLETSQTTLTFTTQELNKAAHAKITVYDRVTNLPKFVEPEGLDFKTQEVKNTSGDVTGYNNIVTWDSVAYVYPKNSTTPTLAETNGGVAKGLRGYKVTITDESGAEHTYNVGTTPQYPSKEMLERVGTDNAIDFLPLEDGKEYSVKVSAIGDNQYTVSGADSDPIKFYKLATLKDGGMTNNNGTISFTSPELAVQYQLYYLGLDRDPVGRTTSAGANESVKYTDVDQNYFGNYRQYSFSTVFYPANCLPGMKYYKEQNDVRYYPSNPSPIFQVQALKSPKVTNVDTTKEMTIGGVAFTDVNDTSKLSWSVDVIYNASFGQKFRYSLYKSGENTPISNWNKIETKDLSVSLAGLSTGKYKLEVETIGNASNTITSPITTYEFNVVPDLKLNTNTTLEGDTLKINVAPYTVGGADLFFVNNSNLGLSAYKTYTVKNVISGAPAGTQEAEIDLSSFELPAGIYSLYAKPISYFNENENTRNAVVVPNTLNPIVTIQVVKGVAPETAYISADSMVYWDLVSDDGYFYDYKLIYGTKEAGSTNNYSNFHTINVSNNAGEKVYAYDITDVQVSEAVTKKVASINIRQLLSKYHADTGTPVDVETENGLFSSTNDFIFYIVTTGYKDSNSDGNNDANYVSSSKSPEKGINFATQVPVSDLELNDYVLTFGAVGTGQQRYIVGIRVSETIEDEGGVTTNIIDSYETAPFVGSITNQRVSVNLKDKSYADLINIINPDYDNTIYVRAIGYSGTSSGAGKLNSVDTRNTIETTNKPSNVLITETAREDGSGLYDYILTWDAVESEGRTYTINFYTINDSEEKTSVDLGNDATKYTKISKDSVVEVGTILANNIGKVVGIEVVEHKSNMFDGHPSELIYATRMASPVLTYAIDENSNYTIKWDNIANADSYDVNVTTEGLGEGGEVETINKDTTSITLDASDTSTYKSYTINTSWGVGTYDVTVFAKNANNGVRGSSYETPFIITSVPTTTPVYIVSNAISVNIKSDGETLTWADITAVSGNSNIQANYSIGVNGGEAVDLGTAREYNASTFDAGTNDVVITPSIDYTESGFILINNTTTNSINKWQKADTLNAVNGNLTFRVYGGVDSNVITIDLYTADKTEDAGNVTYNNYTLVDKSKYYYSSKSTTEGSYTFLEYTLVLDGVTPGKLNLAVKVRSDGKINSEISDIYEGEKIASVSDFQKVGDCLQWTPVTGASQYEITYRVNGSEESTTILTEVVENGGSYTAYIVTTDEDGTTNKTTSDDFIYESGVFKYKFYEETVFGTLTGDIYFKIRPITSLDGYFSGNSTNEYTITKLNVDVRISAVDGKINISNFVADGTYSPQYYTISIYRLITQTTGEGDDAETTTERDTTNYWHADNVAYTSKEDHTALVIDPIDLNELDIDSFKEAGEYEIELTLIGNNNEILTSSTITHIISKLSTTSLSTDAGSITWAHIDGVKSYTLEVTDSAGNVKEFVITPDGLSTVILDESLLKYTIQVEVPKEDVVVPPVDNGEEDSDGIEVIDDETSDDIQYTDQEVQFTFEAGAIYTLRIKSNEDNSLHSKWSEEFRVKRLYAPTNLQISANTEPLEINEDKEIDNGDGTTSTITETTTINIGSPVITWLNINQTTVNTKYELIYVDAGGQVVKSIIIDAETYTDASTSLIYAITTEMPVGAYAVKIKVFGNTCIGENNAIGLLTSFYSFEVTANYVRDVATISISNGVISWNSSVAGAYSYKLSAYEMSNYNEYLEDNSKDLNLEFQKYTTATQMNFSSTSLADISTKVGSYTFVINAITDPSLGIVSTHEDTEITNTASLFKPQVLENYKVKNGMLNWKIAVDDGSNADIESFVENHIATQEDSTTTLQDVLNFVVDTINGESSGEESQDTTLAGQLTHLLKVQLIVNGIQLPSVSPTMAVLIDENNNQTTADNAKYIEYYYNVGMEPEIDNSTDTNNGSGDNQEMVLAGARAMSDATDMTYEKGRYTISLSPLGNSDKNVAVVSGGFTSELTAYKPDTPTTYTSTAGADISFGYVQWELPTTATSTETEFEYHKNYKITAVPVNGDRVVETTIKIQDQDIESDDRVSKYLKELFSAGYAYEYTTKNVTIEDISNYGIVLDTLSFDVHVQKESGNTIIENGIKYILTQDAGTHAYTLTRLALDTNNEYTISQTIALDTSILGLNTITDPVYNYINIEYTVVYDEGNSLNEITSFTFINKNIIYNDNYRLLINVMGTIDSEHNNGETIYLNSNYCTVRNIANILDIPTINNNSFTNSNINWGSNQNVQATRLFIYGPFNNTTTKTITVNSDDDTTVDEIRGVLNSNWSNLTNGNVVSESILNNLYNMYLEDPTKSSFIDGTNNRLRVIELPWENGAQVTEYTLTNMIERDESFGAGGYVIQFQQLGDNRGIVDSVVTDITETKQDGNGTYTFAKYAVNKLDKVVMQEVTGGWVGTTDSSIYMWDPESDTWAEKKYEQGTLNENIGVFVWNPVTGANAYKIEAFKVQINEQDKTVIAGTEERLYDPEYTRETRYEIRNSSLYNEDNKKYFIKITAIRTAGTEELNSTTTAPDLAPYFFSSDESQTTEHSRIAIPKGLKIFGTGEIQWNIVESSVISNYRIQFNYQINDTNFGSELDTTSYTDTPTFTFNGNSAGKIDIAIKAMEVTGSGYLNSSYCTAVTVERLSDPDVRLVNGIFNWGSGSTPKTPTDLIIDFKPTDGDGYDIEEDTEAWKEAWMNAEKTVYSEDENNVYSTEVKYYTDITSHNGSYSAERDENIYTPEEHTFTVQYQGTSSEDGSGVEMNGTETFYIASKIVTLKATKLNAPVIENVSVDVTGTSSNVVKWAMDSNAQGYRVRAFSSIEESTPIEIDVSKETLDNLLTNNITTNEYFLVATEGTTTNVYFKVDKILGSEDNQFDILRNGGYVYIYVQALGSGVTVDVSEGEEGLATARPEDGKTLYLSSSYSTPTTIGLPPTPEVENGYYDETSGLLTWKVGDDSNNKYNIKLVITYSLSGISEETFSNYWAKTATSIGTSASTLATNNNDGMFNPYSEIESRQVIYNSVDTIYSIQVVDIVKLNYNDYNGVTPTYYQLTVSGPTDYHFEITALSFPDGEENADEKFVSAPLRITSNHPFKTFDVGDGSSYYPYTIKDYVQLNSIRKFLSRNFTITSDIDLNTVDTSTVPYPHSTQKLWTPIAGTFTGTIDGGNYSIKNIYYSVDGAMYTIEGKVNSQYKVATNGTTAYLSFIENIGSTGIIKNLNLEMNIKDTQSHSNKNVQIAPIAIQNAGIIDNVHVTGSINLQLDDVASTSVAGLVVYNTGLINSSSVNSTITALDNSEYAVYVGGIATSNIGSITNSNFSGSITSNIIGGITADNQGVIDRCYADNAELHATDKSTTSSGKRSIAGGITATMSPSSSMDAMITNSYSKANIYYSIDNANSAMAVGGLVGSIVDSDLQDNYTNTIMNCYVVTNINAEGTVNGRLTLYAMIPNTTDATLESNYYIISGGSGYTTDGGTQVQTSTSLRGYLEQLKDSEGKIVYYYATAGTEYPVHQTYTN